MTFGSSPFDGLVGQLTMRGQLTAHRIKPEYDGAAEELASLDQVLVSLDRAITSTQVARAVVEGGRSAVGACDGALVELTPDRRELRVLYTVGDVTTRVANEGRLPLTAEFPLCDVVRSRQELWLTNPAELAVRYPDAAPVEGSMAWAVLPLVIDHVILGAVGWSFQRELITPYQRECLRSLVEAGGVALYRAGLFDSEQSARMGAELANYELVRRDRLATGVSTILDSVWDKTRVSECLERVARETLPRMGEWCCFHVIDERDRLRLAAAIHTEPSREPILKRLVSASASSGHKLHHPLTRGEPVVVGSLSSELPPAVLPQRHFRALRMVGLERFLMLPLRIHGETLGAISFGASEAALPYDDSDVAVARRVAQGCAAWLEYLRTHEKAERANQALEDFVAATSHELRTPLSHIKGFVSTLRTTDTVWDVSTRDDFLAEIEQEADRLALLVDTLLDLSRIDAAGLDPMQQQPTPVAGLLTAGIDRVRVSLGERRLDLQVPEDLPRVWADASHVERAIANLLDNAAKYSPPDDPIRVTATTAGRFVVFRVEDRGLGIPPEHLERIFEPFFREPTGPYPAKPGTGLGLAICRSIIRAHRGRIWAEQRPGGGAVLAFTLPIAAGTRRT